MRSSRLARDRMNLCAENVTNQHPVVQNMPDIVFEQAIYGGQDSGSYRLLARSPGFFDEWDGEANHLCASFGKRPAGVSCPRCVFARPFDRKHVAIANGFDDGFKIV